MLLDCRIELDGIWKVFLGLFLNGSSEVLTAWICTEAVLEHGQILPFCIQAVSNVLDVQY